MGTILRLRTRVLPGHRIEICDRSLPDGVMVDVTINLVPVESPHKTLLQIMRETPPSERPQAAESWEMYEQLLQQEREAWDR
jgi:hypothetical protein